MRTRIGIAIAALLLEPALYASDYCVYSIVDTSTVTVTDGGGNVIGQWERYYFGWLCFPRGGGGSANCVTDCNNP